MTMFREQNLIEFPQEKKPGKKKKGLSKKTINIIRTAQRNNIDLTAIADNKANVLLSLNAIMITCLVPIIFAYLDIILDNKQLFLPLLILGITCFSTIYLSAQVLKPVDFNSFKLTVLGEKDFSPYFFGNFYQMEAKEYYRHMKKSLEDPELIKEHLAQDLFYVGKRLGEKMALTRKAFSIFIVGIFLTLLSLVGGLFLFSIVV
ncbi:MAG: hypothetical protein KDD04_06900 [Sinomicrobium sp.]|nr:hypothetical protein [Sinomicrobium sp.]